MLKTSQKQNYAFYISHEMSQILYNDCMH